MPIFNFGRTTHDEKQIATMNHESSAVATDEGQLSVDIVETMREIVIVAPIAGVRGNALEIAVSDHTLSIRGERSYDLTTSIEKNLVTECFWGKFSRSIILPDNADTEKVQAKMRHGVLYVTVPKAGTQKTVRVTEEE